MRLVCTHLKVENDLYDKPLESGKLSISLVRDDSEEIHEHFIEEILAKVYRIPHTNNYQVCLRLIHKFVP